MTWITIYNVKMAVTPKADNSELRFVCFTHRIIVIYICIKFQENIWYSFKVTESIFKGHNSKIRLTRVTVL